MRGSPSKIDTMSAHGPKRTRRSVTVAAVFGLKRDAEFNRCPVAMQFSIIFCLYNTHLLSISNSYGPICTLAAAAGRTLRAPKIRDAVHENQNQSDSSPTPCLSRIAVFASVPDPLHGSVCDTRISYPPVIVKSDGPMRLFIRSIANSYQKFMALVVRIKELLSAPSIL